jgi:hypothetical protein
VGIAHGPAAGPCGSGLIAALNERGWNWASYLRDAFRDSAFREDLFFRLNVFPIRVLPLRDRRDDIPQLMNWFMPRACKTHGKAIMGFRERAVSRSSSRTPFAFPFVKSTPRLSISRFSPRISRR